MDDIFKDKRSIKDIIIHELWLDTRIPKVIIEEIIMSEFKFIKYVAMPQYKNVWLQYFGMFGIKPTRLLRYTRNKKQTLECFECGWIGRLAKNIDNEQCCPHCERKLDGIHTEDELL